MHESDETERDLLLDRLIYGTSFHYLKDGKKVRVAPEDVYLKPRWWTYLHPRRLWNRLCRWIRNAVGKSGE